MESLSPKQVRDIKDLYKNVYKEEEVVEEVGDFDDLFESKEFQSLSDELKENIIKKMQDSLAKSDKYGVFGQIERARRKRFGTDDERQKAINFEKNKIIIDRQKRNIPDDQKNKINVTPVISKPEDTIPAPTRGFTPEGEKQAAINKVEFKKNKEINLLKKNLENEKLKNTFKGLENEKKGEVTMKDFESDSNNSIETNNIDKNKNNIDKNKIDKNKIDNNPSGKIIPKPTKPLMTNSPAAKAGIPLDMRQKFANQNAAFQATKIKDSGYSKMDFIKDFPKSQTAMKFNKGEKIPGFSYKKNLNNSYEPYDLVLDYVLSEGHADTVEEAHYVMMQMDEDTIKNIVEILGGRPDDGYLGHPNLNIKNPFFRGKRIKEPVLDKSNADKLPDVNVNKVGAQIGDRNMKLKKLIDDI